MIKEYIPSNLRLRLKRLRNRIRWKGSYRIFCISMQRSGTTSVGKFFSHFGYSVASSGTSRDNGWSKAFYDGDFEKIFRSKNFKSIQVFQDDPWWCSEFYKVLYYRFPNSKFILFTRDSGDWFKSMVSHSNGKTLGNTKRHCKIYRREKEFYNRVDNDPEFKYSDDKVDNLLELQGHEEHYRDIYDIRNREILDFFEERDPDRIIVCNLKDADKWHKLGKFFNINVPADFTMHVGKSKNK